MKRNDIQDLKTKTEEELRRTLSDIRDKVGALSIDKSLGKLKNTNEIKNKKKDIARILTFLSMKREVHKNG